MLSYCLKCRKNIKSKYAKIEIIPWRLMLWSSCAVSSSKKSKFIKEQEASGLKTSLLGKKSPFKGILY